ncbi:1006_t:CDS:10 [Funneliformis caledonium]|uniref:1006_t:CDS:1 n=1 Tax=Funneliformis caledonium TaxID=1117310 RepID=A0A9N9B3D2_9GLOM|nr:1006_t:CDS:10 [Funneliformis caledonium]
MASPSGPARVTSARSADQLPSPLSGPARTVVSTKQLITSPPNEWTSVKYGVSKIPEEEEVHEYFKRIEARYWQLKHYLSFRLKVEETISPWSTVYSDWQQSLRFIFKDYGKNVPGSVSGFCKDLYNICETFEGSIVRQGCKKFYDEFYQRHIDLQIAERLRILDSTIFSENKISEVLRISSKKRIVEDNEESSSSSEKRIRHEEYYVDNFVPELFQEEHDYECYGKENESNSSAECSSPKTIPEKRKQEDDESIMEIFGNEIECSDTMKKIYFEYKKHCHENAIVDLRPRRNFSNNFLIKSLKIIIKKLSRELSGAEWQNKIDDLRPKNDSKLMVATTRIIRRTLPQFIKAFSLGAFNPLLDIKTIEKPHLNSYNHVKRECADGAGYMMGADKFQLVYVEGAKPKAKENKELAVAEKVARNLKTMFTSIVRETINNRRRIPNGMAVFGGQSFQLRIHLFYLDYCEFCLHEIENANLPRDFTEMADFVWYYECILKWALLAYDMTVKFKEIRNQKRPSRQSYAKNIRLLDDHKLK